MVTESNPLLLVFPRNLGSPETVYSITLEFGSPMTFTSTLSVYVPPVGERDSIGVIAETCPAKDKKVTITRVTINNFLYVFILIFKGLLLKNDYDRNTGTLQYLYVKNNLLGAYLFNYYIMDI